MTKRISKKINRSRKVSRRSAKRSAKRSVRRKTRKNVRKTSRRSNRKNLKKTSRKNMKGGGRNCKVFPDGLERCQYENVWYTWKEMTQNGNDGDGMEIWASGDPRHHQESW